MDRDSLIALVARAKQGDAEALNELFNTFYNDVYYFALKTIKDEQIACDVTQETFVEIISTLKDLQEPAAFVKWMKQITYHQCTRYFKKKKDIIVDEDEDGNTVFDTLQEEKAEFIPDEALDKEEFRKTILTMIDTLSEEQRAAVMMFYYDELSIKQIAQIQGVNENTVKSRLNYAKKSIKKSVEEYEKKNGVKLRCVGVLPLLLWLFKGYFSQSVPASAAIVAEGVAAATGTAVTVSATATTVATVTTATTTAAVGVGAKIAALPIATKIIAGIVATTIAVGGTTAVLSKKDADIPDTTSSIVASGNTSENTTSTENPSNSGIYDDPVPEHTPYLVPAGGKYTTADGVVYNAGEYVTVAPQIGDTFETTEYTYRYNLEMNRNWETDNIEWMQLWMDGWGVVTNDKSKTAYAPLEQSINGSPIKSLTFAFMGCENMIVAPQIPDGVSEYYYAFALCTSLKVPPNIPDGAINLNSAFIECFSLTETPYLPDSIINIGNAFVFCTALKTVTNFPSNLKYMAAAFDRCENLINVPELPNTVEEMPWAFQGCSSLVNAPVIPESVKVMYSAFMSCSSLTGTIEINAILREDTIPCNNACELCATGYYDKCENCGDCCSYASCFGGLTKLPITLTGTCTKLQEIAATALNGNIVVE